MQNRIANTSFLGSTEQTIIIKILRLLLGCTCALSLASSAQASEILVTGTFAAGSKTNESPLEKGTFDLTFSADNLPLLPGTSDPLDDWRLQFYSARGTLLASLNALEPSTYGSFRALTGATQGEQLIVGDSAANDVLSLLFPVGFDGAGQVIKSGAFSYAELSGHKNLM